MREPLPQLVEPRLALLLVETEVERRVALAQPCRLAWMDDERLDHARDSMRGEAGLRLASSARS